jgi:hypothetical protein
MTNPLNPLNTHQLLKAYLEIGGFRRNAENNPTDVFIMQSICNELDKMD